MNLDLSADVVVTALSVRYPGGVQALNNVSLRFPKGLFGLLGPNGAGKTTLMRTLATLQKPSSGAAMVFGRDVQEEPGEVRRFLGYLPQDFHTYPQLRIWEVLDFYAILNGISERAQRRRRIDELLKRVGLYEVRSRKAGQLSGGMARRLGVAQALLNDPKLLILDEPTVGLDPAERIHFRNFLSELSRDRTVILSTHIVPDIGSSCDRLAVLDCGSVVFEGRREDLLARTAGKVWTVLVPDAEYEQIKAEFIVSGMTDTFDGLQLRLLADIPLDRSWQGAEPNLEDAYLWLLGNQKPDRAGARLAEPVPV